MYNCLTKVLPLTSITFPIPHSLSLCNVLRSGFPPTYALHKDGWKNAHAIHPSIQRFFFHTHHPTFSDRECRSRSWEFTRPQQWVPRRDLHHMRVAATSPGLPLWAGVQLGAPLWRIAKVIFWQPIKKKEVQWAPGGSARYCNNPGLFPGWVDHLTPQNLQLGSWLRNRIGLWWYLQEWWWCGAPVSVCVAYQGL